MGKTPLIVIKNSLRTTLIVSLFLFDVTFSDRFFFFFFYHKDHLQNNILVKIYTESKKFTFKNYMIWEWLFKQFYFFDIFCDQFLLIFIISNSFFLCLGILGFSQGATMAAHICALSNKQGRNCHCGCRRVALILKIND